MGIKSDWANIMTERPVEFKSQNKGQEKREKMEEIIQESRLDNELETMKGGMSAHSDSKSVFRLRRKI